MGSRPAAPLPPRARLPRMWNLDGERLGTAQSRFREFFGELGTVFVEREDTITQVALSLLSREHMLMTGPPGTGKSALASAVIGRIPDERTGAPSVFARQVTESTVNTDLVGPIDFKTLMSSGRTEHFTDEGMLGAVHAFLDEVLDGRDMLLRSTLNLLQERELKHGHKVTRGDIECALMTTNRYISDVLDQSRETLLAFVDRIAFVNFVPRGFADPKSMDKVLRAMVGGAGFAKLGCLLTVQDLDVLQEAVDRVEVTPEMTERLALLLRELDHEVASTRRADPRFTPTRYLSTRTAVRLGRVLRSAVVYDQATRDPKRPLRALPRDFELLRMSLLLTGPTPEQAITLIETETDATERRQLELIRREREIFDACIARLPEVKRPKGRRKLDIKHWQHIANRALRSDGTTKLINACEKLAEAMERGQPGTDEARPILERVVEELLRRATVAGITAGIGPTEDVHAITGELAELARRIENSSPSQRPIARWLRGQAIEMMDRTIAHAPSLLGENMAAHIAPEEPRDPVEESTKLLWRLRALLHARDHLQSLGADVRDPDGAATQWATGLELVEQELVPIWDDALRVAVELQLTHAKKKDLSTLLDGLSATLGQIDKATEVLAHLRGGSRDAAALKAKVAGPRLGPLVRASFDRFDTRDRLAISDDVDELLGHLKGAGLGSAIDSRQLLHWTALAALRSERERVSDPESLKAEYKGYRILRGQEARVSLTYVLLDVVTRVFPMTAGLLTDPARVEAEAIEQVGALPPDVQSEVAELDLARTERAVRLLERWFHALEHTTVAGDPLQHLVDSRFLHVAFDEGALGRFGLEADIVGRVFPAAAGRARALGERIRTLQTQARARVQTLHGQGAEQQWTRILQLATPAPAPEPS